MKTNLNGSLEEIVFEGRNKAYGSYALRLHYQQRLIFGAMGGTLLFLLLCFLPLIANSISNAFTIGEKDVAPIIVTEYLAPPPEVNVVPPPPPPPPPPVPQKAMVRFVTPKVEDDPEVKQPEEMPEIEDLKGKAIGAFNQDGKTSDNLLPEDIPAPPIVQIPEEPEKKKEDITYDLIGVEQAPEFPGGEKAMYAWLRDNVKFPRILDGMEIKMTIVAGFVVDTEGNVIDIKILRGGNKALEQAVQEGMRKMPSWKPAKQNGKTVKCKFTLPVKFDVQ